MHNSKSGFIQLLLIILLLAGIAIAVYLIQFTQIFKPKASGPGTCQAFTAQDFATCILNVNSGQINSVEVETMIDCPRTGNSNACAFQIHDVHRPVMITGKKGANAGFRRTNWFSGNVFTILNSSQVYVSNLIFDDNKDIACRLIQDFKSNPPSIVADECSTQAVCTPNGCGSPIQVFSSSDVTLDNLQVQYFKKHGIELELSDNATIQNSIIKNGGSLDPDGRPVGSGEYAIHIMGKRFQLINNQIMDIMSNGVSITADATAQNRSRIKGNSFINSAGWNLVNSGGGTMGVIPQVWTAQNPSPFGITNLDIEYNEIKDAHFAKLPIAIPPYQAGSLSANAGVEMNSFSGAQSHNLYIVGNVVHNIEGEYGIGIGPDPVYNNLIVTGNVIYDIRKDPQGTPGDAVKFYNNTALPAGSNVKEFNNCLNSNCLTPAYSTLTAFPDVCIPIAGQCQSDITYSSKGMTDVVLFNRKTGQPLIPAGPAGTVTVTWTDDPSTGFDLYRNGQLTDSLIAKNGKLVEDTLTTYKGAIGATPTVCTLSTAAGTCSAHIYWDASLFGDPTATTEIRLRETGQSVIPSGAIRGGTNPDPDWITAEGYHFDLYVDGVFYDSIFVKGQFNGPSATPSSSPSPISTNTPPIGIFDGVYGSQLIGWACDLDVPATAPYVHIYIDDQFGWVATANKTGEDGIAQYCGGFKDRRVITDIPDKYKDGMAHSVKIYAIDNVSTGTNTMLNGSPKTFTLAPPPPTGTLTASPNPCQITAGSDKCTSAITWDVKNPLPEGVVVKIRSTGQGFAGGALSGTADAWFVTAQGVTLDLYTGTTLLSSIRVTGTLTAAKIGDLDNDTDVDLDDFTIFVGDYRSKNLRSDFNHNGVLDLGDFVLLAQNYGH